VHEPPQMEFDLGVERTDPAGERPSRRRQARAVPGAQLPLDLEQ
jgi:hypothetical protein